MRQPHKMVKHTQTIRRLLPTNYLSVFDHFVGLALKELKKPEILNFVRRYLTHWPISCNLPLSIPPENIRKIRFSEVFRGIKSDIEKGCRPVVWNGLNPMFPLMESSQLIPIANQSTCLIKLMRQAWCLL